MKNLKKYLFLLICLLTFCAFGSCKVQAAGDSTYHTFTYVNPVYKNLIDPSQYTEPSLPEEGCLVAAEDVSFYQSPEEAALYVRECLVNRQKDITFGFRMSGTNLDATFDTIMDTAVAHTGNPTEGDYIRYQYGMARGYYTYQHNNYDGYYYCHYYMSMIYYTDASQEKDVTNELRQVLSGLNLDGQTDYEKVCRIYDYICKHVSYVEEEDSDYLLQYTAYAALIDKTAVCQGYANLFYRMTLEAGVDSRIIGGTGISGGSSGPHAWNIVQLYGKYYNLDSTWDDQLSSRQYFLISPSEFDRDHIRDEDYTTTSFKNAYPMDTQAFASSKATHTHTVGNGTSEKGNTIAPTCTESGYTPYKCSICGQTFKGNLTSPLGHALVTDAAVAATPSHNGYEAGKHCSRCGNIYGRAVIYAPFAQLSTCNLVYNGSVQKPGVTVTDTAGKTVPSSYYTVSYPSGCKNVGSYTVTITFKGKYSGTTKRTFGIFPKATAIKKLSKASKAFTVKWTKKTAQTTGYIIQYATNSSFSGAKTITISKYKTVSKKISKLAKKKRYYVRIRTYKKVGATKYVSSWSAVKSVVTK